MKFALLLVTALFSFSASAAKDALIITEVSVQTPLPTGLESMEAPAPNPERLPELVFNHPGVKPLLDAVYKLHKNKIDRNVAAGDMFHRRGWAQVDCRQQPSIYLRKDADYCAIEVTMSFGWYADLDLAFVVRGFVLKSEVPANQR